MRERARRLRCRIVLTDGEDPRAQAAARVLAESMALTPVLVGSRERIPPGPGVDVYDPATDPRQADLVALLSERLASAPAAARREASGQLAARPEMCGALMVAAGLADGMVGGALVPTADVLRAAIRVVGVRRDRPLVTGCFAMLLAAPTPGGQTALVIADAAVVPDPDATQLGIIALSTAEVARSVLGLTPNVALLSYASWGSADGPSVRKVREALAWLRRHAPNLRVDGELQADAALVPEISERKAPGNAVAGAANVLVVPNLDTGNIAYKLLERVAGAKALGVILSGLNRPVNDLSRGAGVGDIVDMAAVTALQAQVGAHEGSV